MQYIFTNITSKNVKVIFRCKINIDKAAMLTLYLPTALLLGRQWI